MQYFFKKGKKLSQLKRAVFLLIFAICSHAYPRDSANDPIKQTSVGNQIVCPSRDFSEFIKAFSESKEVQMNFTMYPLKEQRLDLNAEPEPKPVIRKLRRDQVAFPVMPNEVERKQKNLVLRVDQKKSNHVELTLVKSDTDYQVNYFFILNSCWNLERIEDWSH